MQDRVLPSQQRKIFGHPVGLFVLFFTEMWERFSYYGMRALLVLYMTKYLFLEAEKGMEIFGYSTIHSIVESIIRGSGVVGDIPVQAISSQIYGFYTGLVYLTPFFGGVLADRVFGQRKSVYIGGFLMAIGHFLMAIESMFFLALLFLILGNGCFKPNISVQVGDLYDDTDPRKDSAYMIFYMGINLGAFFSPLVCGTLGQKVGWHWGFGAAGIGMLVGLVVYHFGRKYLPADKRQIAAENKMEDKALTSAEWKSVFALVILCVVNILFWAVYEQQGNTMQLWADERTNWNFFGWDFPTTWFQSVNPLFIFIFTPIIIRYWAWQSKRGRDMTTVGKMGMGSLQLGAAFIIMIIAAKVVPENEKGSLLWLIATTWVVTMGELYLSPTGLSLVSKLAPARLMSMMMGLWLGSSAIGNYLSGYIGGYYEIWSKEKFFSCMVILGVSAALIFFAAKKPLNRIIGRAV